MPSQPAILQLLFTVFFAILFALHGTGGGGMSENLMSLSMSGDSYLKLYGDGKMIKHWSAKDYVQDGLIAMWDGIENAGWGVHDPNARTVTNLAGGDPLVLSDDAEVGGNYIANASTTPGGTSEQEYTFDCRIEVVGSITGTAQWKWCAFIDNGSYGIGTWNPISRSSIRIDSSIWANTQSNTSSVRQYSVSQPLLPYGKTIYINKQPYSLGSRDTFQPTVTSTSLMICAVDTAKVKLHTLRIYNRALTSTEIAHNYAIDKVRFNLDAQTT